MEAFITINGNPYPMPSRGLNLMAATIVDSGRNANGVLIGQKVGRDQQKIENLEWGYLTASVWSSILKEFDSSFIATVTYPDMVKNTWTTRKMYCGDRTAKPFKLGSDGLPVSYVECKVNLVDTGE